MPKVSSYAQRTRNLTIEFTEDDDDPLHLTYYPRAITPKMERAFSKLQNTDEADQILYESLRALVAWWDLTDEDGAEIPRTREALELLPSQLIKRVVDALQDDMRPNPERSSTSPNGSVPKVNEDRVPIGSSFSG